MPEEDASRQYPFSMELPRASRYEIEFKRHFVASLHLKAVRHLNNGYQIKWTNLSNGDERTPSSGQYWSAMHAGPIMTAFALFSVMQARLSGSATVAHTQTLPTRAAFSQVGCTLPG